MDNALIRKQFPILNQKVHDEPLVYLDTAASMPMPWPVQEKVTRFINRDYANVHRGVYDLSQRATEAYEQVRSKVAHFIGAQDEREIIFTSGTTASLNLVATSFGDLFLQEGDEILISYLEHHANLVPWQILAKRKKARLCYLPLTQGGQIDLAKASDLINKRTKIVAVSQMSNVLGVINDVEALADLVHGQGGVIVVDGAQSVAHQPIWVDKFDFFAFSGHKLGAANGVGVLYGKRTWLEKMAPIQFGGDMINLVEDYESTWAPVPYKFEAGTPNIQGVVSLGYALDWWQSLGMRAVQAYEKDLVLYAREALEKIEGLELYGDSQTGIFSFNLSGIHPHDLATALDLEGIAVRAGHHCAQPLMRYLNLSATVRASLGIYNNRADIDRLVAALIKVKEFFNYGPI